MRCPARPDCTKRSAVVNLQQIKTWILPVSTWLIRSGGSRNLKAQGKYLREAFLTQVGTQATWKITANM